MNEKGERKRKNQNSYSYSLILRGPFNFEHGQSKMYKECSLLKSALLNKLLLPSCEVPPRRRCTIPLGKLHAYCFERTNRRDEVTPYSVGVCSVLRYVVVAP